MKRSCYNGLNFVSFNPSFYRIYFTGKDKKAENLFKNLVEEFKPEIIHFQHLINLPMNLVDIAYKAKIPIIFTAHDYWLLCPRAHLIDNNHILCTENNNKYKCVKCFSNVTLYRFEKVKIFQSNTYIELAKNLIKIVLNPLKKYMQFIIYFILNQKKYKTLLKKLIYLLYLHKG